MTDEGERGAERLVAFTDAVVAIAITLLVLPLADLFSAPTTAAGHSSADLLHRVETHEGALYAFALGFVLIARLWWAHHRLFEPVRHWTLPLVVLDLLWTFTIVCIPVTTAMLPHYDSWPLEFGIYCGTLVVSGAAQAGMAALIHRSDAITTARGADTRNRLIGSAATVVAFVLALVLGITTHITFLALLLVAVTDPFERLVRRHYDRRDAALSVSGGSATLD